MLNNAARRIYRGQTEEIKKVKLKNPETSGGCPAVAPASLICPYGKSKTRRGDLVLGKSLRNFS